MADITDQGFVSKTQNEYFDQEIALYKGIDPDWNLDPSTPDGLKAAHDAEIFGNLDEQALAAYNSKDPSTATGIDLNRIGAITGSFRNFGTPSNVALTLGGVVGTTILAGKEVKSSVDSSLWSIDQTVTIGSGGTVAATATALENGPTQANIGTITQIQTTVAGWQTVTNPTVATPGTPTENDGQFRLRRALSVGLPGNNQTDAMRGAISNVDGVRRLEIYENDTNSVDSKGLPAHSIAVVVDGGTNYDVALQIYLKKNPGVFLHPAATPEVVLVTSPTYPTNKKSITFSRPNQIDITVNAEIKDDGTLPNTAATDIENAILEYVEQSLIAPTCGFNNTGFAIGENVVLSRFYTPINNYIGKFGNSFVSDLKLNGGTSNITIAFNELSRFTPSNIQVSVV